MAVPSTGIAVSALPTAGTLDGTETVPVVQGGVTKKMAGPMALAGAQTVTGVKTFNAGALLDKGSTVHNVKAYGAVGDGTTDDLPAITAALAAIDAASPTNAYTTYKAASNGLLLPATAASYKVTGPVVVATDHSTVRGGGPGVPIKNTAAASHVIQVARAAAGVPSDVRLADLNLVGTGATSRAIYADETDHLTIERVNTFGHGGPSLYLESTGTDLDGCAFTNVVDLIASPSAAVSAVVDIGGLNNLYINPRIREAEVGIDFVDSDHAQIIGGRIESNNRGTAQTGIRGRTSDTTTDPRLKTRRSASIRGVYAESNPLYFADFDYGYVVGIEDCFVAGGSIDNLVPSDAIRLDGGGNLRRVMSSGGVKVSSTKGRVEVQDCSGIYGRASQLVVEGVTLPIRHATNAATQSWFDTSVAFGTGGSSLPTVAHSTTTGFHGTNSQKVTFPSGGAGYAFSRVFVNNAQAAVVAGQLVRMVMAIKASVAGKLLNVRLLAPGTDSQPLEIVTDTEWTIVTLEVMSDGAGTAQPVLHMATDPGAAIDIYVGGVGIAVDAEVSMHNTEAPVLDATRSSAVTHGPVSFVSGRQIAGMDGADSWRAGYYQQPSGTVTTAYAPANADMHLTSFGSVGGTIDRIGVNITIAGSAGALVRLGIFSSLPTGMPGSLLFDAGTIAAESTGTREITISQVLPAGKLWLAMVTQGAPSTVPTYRSITDVSGVPTSGAPAQGGAALYQSGITGALPSSFTVAGSVGAIPRIFVRMA